MGASRTVVPGILMLMLVLAGCTAEVEDPGRLPDVEVENGELPEVDVDPAEVEVTTDTQTVRVPEVELSR